MNPLALNGRRASLVLAGALLLFVSLTAFAADLMEEIIVTAQKREQAIQDVPIAITAFSGEQLSDLGFRENTDVVAMTPGVSVSGNIGGQFLTFNIRGVSQSDFADLHESPNAVYIDQIYLSLMQADKFGLFDSERIEILKGPQGTLYGRNATGGLVQYITRKPTPTFEAYADLTYGSFNATRFEGALSGPLTANVRGRMALLYDRHDCIYRNQVPGADNEWCERTIAARAHLLWSPSSNVDLLLSAAAGETVDSTAPWRPFPTIAVVDADGNIVDTLRTSATEARAGIGPGGVDFCPVCLFVGPRPVPGADAFGYRDPDHGDRRVYKDFASDDTAKYRMNSGTAELNWHFGTLTLTSLTDYRVMEKKGVRADVDASPNDVLDFRADAKDDQFSQELRLASESEHLRWLLGAYYLNYDLNATQGAFGLNPATNRIGVGGLQFVSPARIETKSYSVFGQTEFRLTQSLRATTGLRLIKDQKDFRHRAQLLALDGTVLVPDFEGFPGVTLSNTQNLQHDDNLWAGKAQLDWRPTADLMVYGGVSRGVKGGGFNQQLGGIFAIDKFEYGPETLTAYEVGFKSTLLNDTTRLNASLYYYNYADFQAHAANNLLFFVINADATIKGAELELATRPIAGLNLNAGFSYVDAKVHDVPLATGPLGSGQKRYVDVEPTFTPKVQAFALARYEWSSYAGGMMAIQGDANYHGTSFTNITNFASTKMDSYVIGNVSLSYDTADKRWHTQVYVKNVGDALAEQLGFDMSSLFGGSLRAYLPPRTFGVNVRYSWR